MKKKLDAQHAQKLRPRYEAEAYASIQSKSVSDCSNCTALWTQWFIQNDALSFIAIRKKCGRSSGREECTH